MSADFFLGNIDESQPLIVTHDFEDWLCTKHHQFYVALYDIKALAERFRKERGIEYEKRLVAKVTKAVLDAPLFDDPENT